MARLELCWNNVFRRIFWVLEAGICERFTFYSTVVKTQELPFNYLYDSLRWRFLTITEVVSLKDYVLMIFQT